MKDVPKQSFSERFPSDGGTVVRVRIEPKSEISGKFRIKRIDIYHYQSIGTRFGRVSFEYPTDGGDPQLSYAWFKNGKEMDEFHAEHAWGDEPTLLPWPLHYRLNDREFLAIANEMMGKLHLELGAHFKHEAKKLDAETRYLINEAHRSAYSCKQLS